MAQRIWSIEKKNVAPPNIALQIQTQLNEKQPKLTSCFQNIKLLSNMFEWKSSILRTGSSHLTVIMMVGKFIEKMN